MVSTRKLLRRLTILVKSPGMELVRQRERLDRAYLRRAGVPRAVERLHGPPPPQLGRDEVIAICVMRDGEYWIDEFIRHHTRLGVRHFVFFDNGSQDRSRQLLAAHDQVTVYSLPLPYQRAYRPTRAWALDAFARDRWALMLDVDELFDYPFSDRLPLTELTRTLRDGGASALSALMLDMFPAEPLRWNDERPFDRRRFDRYDVVDLETKPYAKRWRIEQPDPPIAAWEGGVRRRVLGVSPCLTKHPLVLGDGRADVALSAHFTAHARLSSTTGVLFHYKFVPGFAAQVRRAVAEGNYFEGSREYRSYIEHTEPTDALDFMSPSARRLVRTDQLIDEGLMRVGPEWRARANREPERT